MSLNLPRFQSSVQLVDNNGYPTQAFHIWWDQFASAIESSVNDLSDQVAAIQAAQAAADRALSTMPELSPITITADYLGAVSPSVQIPMIVKATRLQDNVDVSSSSTWGVTAEAGAVTATIDGSGNVTISALTDSDNLTITSTYNSVDRSVVLPITLSIAAAPATGGGGGTSYTDNSFVAVSNSTMTAISDELTVTVGSSGQVQLSAPLTVKTGATGLDNDYPVQAIWRHWDGSAYVDIGTAVLSNPDCSVVGSRCLNGTLNVAQTVTGLTPAASEKFQLYAATVGYIKSMFFSGTASAVGS